jgi:hypothetical protein
MVRLSIVDTGFGMSDAALQNAGNPYFSTKIGTGLWRWSDSLWKPGGCLSITARRGMAQQPICGCRSCLRPSLAEPKLTAEGFDEREFSKEKGMVSWNSGLGSHGLRRRFSNLLHPTIDRNYTICAARGLPTRAARSWSKRGTQCRDFVDSVDDTSPRREQKEVRQ